jgi:hypothetical protein
LEKRIIYSKNFENYLIDLIDLLFYKDYFSYLENAENYVVRLKEEIDNYIDLKQHYPSPEELSVYGKQFIIISLNKKTSRYVFFDKKDNRYLIQYITNNHNEQAGLLKIVSKK